MSDGLDDLLNDSTSTDAGTPAGGKGGGLRAQLEAVLAERQALKDQLAQIQASQRQRDLGELFTKHSIPELARDFFPADKELSDETALSFVERYGALWGAQPAATTTPPADQAAAQAIAQMASTATQPTLKPLSEDEYRAHFAEAKSMADLKQIMAGLGAAMPG